MNPQAERVVALYRSLSQIPILTSAKILHKSVIISTWTERNLERNKAAKILFTHQIDKDLKVTSKSTFGIDISEELLADCSPSNDFRAVIREQSGHKKSKKQFLELWSEKCMMKCIELGALDIHGDVYADSEFGSFCWDNTESKILYIAERKLPKSEPFFKRQSIKSKPKIESDDNIPISKGTEYDFKAEWGEQLVNKHLSSIVICNLELEQFTIVDWIPESWCPGQVSWAPDASSIIGVAWETEPRRLGLIFCTNRPSYIFNATLDGKYQIISPQGKAVRSPRFSNDGKSLIWLQRNVGGPHHASHQLVKTAWPLTEKPVIEVIVDLVNDEIEIDGNEKFNGLYCQNILRRGFASDGKRIIITTPQKTEAKTYVINLESKAIVDISDKSFPSSTIVLDVNDDHIVASRTSLKQPSQLIVAKLPQAGQENTIKWSLVDANSKNPLSDIITNSKLEYMELEHENVNDTTKNFTAIFFGNLSPDVSLKSLILWPHGGPHSNFINSFSIEAALMCSLGFSMVQVNYRGSSGAGENCLNYLPGKVGDADVKDCILAADKAMKQFSLDENKLVLMGHSHGGFLVTHLSGQYPDKFKAVVAGNPVTDIASMFNASDIPDWCMVEVGAEFSDIGPISDELLLKMRNASPLAHSHKVTAPTLLRLGSKDQRVPCFQGIQHYNKIRANGCKARLLMYDDNHSLGSSKNETDEIINGALWLLEHTQ